MLSFQRNDKARELDSRADRHLQEGRHSVAEWLSTAAAELRESEGDEPTEVSR
jgi:hypothetical protein